ncbi:Sec-independent protein translocase protein TatC [Agromyces rhizosphaerae]|uniref:Sec-independent protein translocase protein TatC n=2 Tax=Agromyces rhizosphaerae TaxID=88374 RepID=A0A9W6D0E5_9MICO|nr:Sec-independent protein translocase protein TatC [Agromyces rhizosphaerae]
MAARAPRGANREKRMSLGEHLIELRNRLFKSAIAIVVGAVLGWILSEWVWDALREPVNQIVESQSRDAEITYPTITGAFDLRLQIAFTLGIVIASPVWLYQVFAFLVPGLNKKERRYTFAFFFTAIPLFFAGCAAGWYVLPNVVALMTSFVPSDDVSYLDAKIYFDFVLKLVLAIGIGFVVPVFLVLLNFVGILSAATLIKSWRIAILVIVLFTALATPAADVISMFMLAIPMILLYFVAWFIAYLHDKRAAKRLRELEEGLAA